MGEVAAGAIDLCGGLIDGPTLAWRIATLCVLLVESVRLTWKSMAYFMNRQYQKTFNIVGQS